MLQDKNIQIKKHLGQNFLIDRNSRKKILSFADIGENDTVIEIGPGLGALTEELAGKVKDLYAFEIDSELCAVLKERFSGFKNFHLLESDFLQTSESFWNNLPSKKIKVISNTPYYLSSQIAMAVIKLRKKIKLALLTVQKEVGEKMTGSPGHKNYGPVSVLNYIYTDIKICYSLKKDVFFPRPEVNSVVVKIMPLEQPKIHIKEEQLFADFLFNIFKYRRKKLSNVANRIFLLEKDAFENAVAKAGISPDIRAENLAPEELYKIFEIVNCTKSPALHN